MGYPRFHFLAFILLTLSNQKKNAAEPAKPHLEPYSLSLLETCRTMSLRKLHDPVRTSLYPISSRGSSGSSHGWLFLGCEQQTRVMTQTWMGQTTSLLLDLLLDELLAGLTSIASETLHAGLSALKATGTTSVIAEQPLPIIVSLADHVSVLVNEATRSIESMTELPANTIST